MRNTILFLVMTICVVSTASERYASGVFHLVDGSNIETRKSEAASVAEILGNEFSDLSRQIDLREAGSISDLTHHHRTYQAFYRGRPVLDGYFKTHYRRSGFLELATNGLEFLPTDSNWAEDENRYLKRRYEIVDQFRKTYGGEPGLFRTEKVWWPDRKRQKYLPALDVRITSRRHGVIRHFIVDEMTGALIEEKRVARFLDSNPAKVYTSDPLVDSSLTSVILTGLDAVDDLTNGYFRVRRDQAAGTGNFIKINPSPSSDYTQMAGWSADPANFNPGCTGTSDTSCPNQSFDGVNVYYQLYNFRSKLATYFSTLGASNPLSAREPLQVFVSYGNADLDNTGSKLDDSNNAAYVQTFCDDPTNQVPRCLVFLRPESITSSECGSGSKKLFDIAREGGTVVHEYQHFVTDSITHIVTGGRVFTSAVTVGDALHEGYSDYFGASHVSAFSNKNVVNALGYSFQNCSYYVRNLDTIRVFPNSSADQDPHTSGLSWASGLWQLRKDIGVEKADLIALKSLFFLSSNPGFVESIESLVRADNAIYGGVHAGTIRDIFYRQVRFVGAGTSRFIDPASGRVEVGFDSCAATHGRGSPMGLGILALWFCSIVWIGRRYRWQ